MSLATDPSKDASCAATCVLVFCIQLCQPVGGAEGRPEVEGGVLSTTSDFRYVRTVPKHIRTRMLWLKTRAPSWCTGSSAFGQNSPEPSLLYPILATW